MVTAEAIILRSGVLWATPFFPHQHVFTREAVIDAANKAGWAIRKLPHGQVEALATVTLTPEQVLKIKNGF